MEMFALAFFFFFYISRYQLTSSLGISCKINNYSSIFITLVDSEYQACERKRNTAPRRTLDTYHRLSRCSFILHTVPVPPIFKSIDTMLRWHVQSNCNLTSNSFTSLSPVTYQFSWAWKVLVNNLRLILTVI